MGNTPFTWDGLSINLPLIIRFMLNRLLSTALLVAGLGAQNPVLVYDNGPLESPPGSGVSDLQATALGHNVYGYGGQLGGANDNSCFDQFVVANAMVVDEVEFYTYQTNAGVPSTINGAHIAFYDSDPTSQVLLMEMAGSPSIATNMFSTPGNPVSNAYSGIDRTLEGNGATDRRIIAVRIRLENAAGVATPLVLTPGTYWLQIQASGSPAFSGPWMPPITSPNVSVTGDAMHLIGVTYFFTNPVLSGGQAQGLPFKLYGSAAAPGSITNVAANSHGLNISVLGAPNLGGFVRTEVSGGVAGGIPVLGFDFGANVTQFCGANFVHPFPVALWFATENELALPIDPSFAGATISIQAAELLINGGGACLGAANISDGYAIVVNT